MNYTEILARQEELAKEMEELQQARIACAKNCESLNVTEHLTSDRKVDIDVNYDTKTKDIFAIHEGDNVVTFTVEDYNEMSQFFSKYNDAIFSYMSAITKEEEAETEEA